MTSKQRRDQKGKDGDPGQGKEEKRTIRGKACADAIVKFITLYANFKKLMKNKKENIKL